MATAQMTTKQSIDYHATKLINNVARLFDVNNENSKLSDVQIKIGNRTFYCHKLVLQLNSPYFFEAVFHSNTLTLTNFSPDLFYDVLQYMYAGEVLVSTDNIESLLTAADVLCMNDLKKVCFQHLNDSLNDDNSLLYWMLANRYEQTELAAKCKAQAGHQAFHGTPTGLESCLLIVGLDLGPTAVSEVYRISLQHQDKVTSLAAIPTEMNCGSSACLVNNNVYITGAGVHPYKEAWNWNVLSGWNKCADMLTGRRFHCAAVVDLMLYVLGGWIDTDNQTLSSVECYNTKTNDWSSAGQLIHAVQDAGCVTYNNSIYVFGGMNRDDETVAHVQVYNLSLETCTLMDKPMPHANNQMRAVLWETSAILLGCDTCFIYNFETETWREKAQFKTDANYFGLILDNTTVYIAGGGTGKTYKDNDAIWICTDAIRSASVLDIIQDEPAVWKHHAKLTKPAIIDSYINISLPFHI